MIGSPIFRIVVVGVLASSYFCSTSNALATHATANIEISAGGDNTWLLRISQQVAGPNGWRQQVEIVIPREQSVVPVAKIIQYKSVIEYNNGDSSSLTSAPPFGFLLFGSDFEGATVEIRLVELFDKRKFIPSSINGIYHFTYPK